MLAKERFWWNTRVVGFIESKFKAILQGQKMGEILQRLRGIHFVILAPDVSADDRVVLF